MDAAALAERALGVGRETDNFAFVHVGTGIGMSLVLGGRLHRGVHGVAGEIAFLPLGSDPPAWGDPLTGDVLPAQDSRAIADGTAIQDGAAINDGATGYDG